jgi:hypothetical protein
MKYYNTISLVSLFTIAFLLFLYVIRNPKNNGHNCLYKDCPFTGQFTFKGGADGCSPQTICWALDSVHFRHPEWTYDECDSALIKIIKY